MVRSKFHPLSVFHVESPLHSCISGDNLRFTSGSFPISGRNELGRCTNVAVTFSQIQPDFHLVNFADKLLLTVQLFAGKEGGKTTTTITKRQNERFANFVLILRMICFLSTTICIAL